MVWSGGGDNSKSVVVELLERCLGTYRIKFPTSLLTGKRTQSSGATPEMARIKGVRMAFLQEPDNTANMNIGVVKELSGNDSVYVRGLYKEGQEVKPMFKLVLICNKKPNVPSEDKATWNRLRVLPFESTFSMDAPKDRDEQWRTKTFPMDPCFGAKLTRMVQPFTWMLTQEFKIYLKKGIREPLRVQKATNEYRRANDTYLEFIDSYVEEKAGGKIRINELYTLFKDWYKDGFPGQKVPSRTDLKNDLVRRWGKPTRLVWKGWQLREDDESDDEVEEDGYVVEEDDNE
jgi:P4 family phage/plasmid primase-like protien